MQVSTETIAWGRQEKPRKFRLDPKHMSPATAGGLWAVELTHSSGSRAGPMLPKAAPPPFPPPTSAEARGRVTWSGQHDIVMIHSDLEDEGTDGL